jgi:pimeloyl-ACP methyl ester carboxylesterase
MIETREVKVGGNSASYITGGIEPGKKNIVFVHSAGSTGKIWEREVSYFSEWYNTIAPDLPGRGGTGGEGKTDAFDYADFVKEVMTVLDFYPAVIVGLSMGGAVAQALALTYPDYAEGLVLSGTGAKMPVIPQVFEVIKDDYEKYLEFAGKFAFGPETPEEVVLRSREIFKSVRPEVASCDYTTCNTFDSRGRISEIDVPTLILCGDKDLLMPPKFSVYLNQNIKGSRLEMFPGVGHIIMSEAEEKFREVVLEFIRGL